MAKIKILGTASAVPNAAHHNTHFLIEGGNRSILVDCPGNPFVRLHQAQIDPISITDLILTHFHPDHVSGLPLLLMDMWLMKRTAPLSIYGLKEVLDKSQTLMTLYNWQEWDEFYPVNFIIIPKNEKNLILETENVQILTSPTHHIISSVGIKVDFKEGSFCYSGDTAPCDEIIRLAEGCDLLIHEATGEEDGHSSASDAGRIAQASSVNRLCLIHYQTDRNPQDLIDEAKAHFDGYVFVAEDLMTVEI